MTVTLKMVIIIISRSSGSSSSSIKLFLKDHLKSYK